MKLYYSRGACSLAPHIALYETGLPFTVARTDTKTKLLEDGSDFRAISPNGYVPVLELDSGERLTEAGVVLQYIADQKPASGLIPALGTLERYRVMEWLTFISSEVHKSYSPLFRPTTPEDYKPVAKTLLAQRLGYVNEQLAGKQFLLGDQFTVADAYLFVVVNWSRAVGVDLSPFPNLQQFQERVAKRPAVQSALKAEGLVK
ncbi:MAG TPA: glutathione transferase GstA [Povalibacter sp.]|nr:glutathione transferase GstA [Povalibacter sp.]